MGGMFKPSKAETTQTNELPAWMDQYGQYLAGGSQHWANQPYQGYDGDRTAGFNPMQQNAMGSMDQYGNMGLPALGGAYNALGDTTGAGMMGNAYGLMGQFAGDLSNMDPVMAERVKAAQSSYADAGNAQQGTAAQRGDIRDVQGGSFLDQDLGAYMNPYTQNVSENINQNQNRAWQQKEQQLGSAAQKAGAFGGSRHGVEGAISASENERNTGQMQNQLWNQAYGAASNMMGQDLSRGLQADLSNQGMDWNAANAGQQASLQNAMMGNNMQQFNAGQENQMGMFNAGQSNQVGMQNAMNALTASGLNQQQQGQMLQALQGMGNLGNQMGNFTQMQGQNLQNFGQSALQSQMNAGNQYQAMDQRQLDQMYNDFTEERDWGLNRFLAAAGMGKGVQTGSTTTDQHLGNSMFDNILGAGQVAGSLKPS